MCRPWPSTYPQDWMAHPPGAVCWQGLLLRERRLSHIPEFILSVCTTQISHSTHYGGGVLTGQRGQGCYVNQGFSPGSEGRAQGPTRLPCSRKLLRALYSLCVSFLSDSSVRTSTFSYLSAFQCIRYFLPSTFCTDLWEMVAAFLKQKDILNWLLEREEERGSERNMDVREPIGRLSHAIH